MSQRGFKTSFGSSKPTTESSSLCMRAIRLENITVMGSESTTRERAETPKGENMGRKLSSFRSSSGQRWMWMDGHAEPLD